MNCVIILGYKRSFERHSWIHVAIQQNSRETFLNRHSRSWKTPGKQTNINRLQIIWLLSNCFFVLPIGPIQVVFRVFPANYQSQTLYYQHLLPGKNQICLVFNLNFMMILEHFVFCMTWYDRTLCRRFCLCCRLIPTPIYKDLASVWTLTNAISVKIPGWACLWHFLTKEWRPGLSHLNNIQTDSLHNTAPFILTTFKILFLVSSIVTNNFVIIISLWW